MTLKKAISLLCTLILSATLLAGCGSGGGSSSTNGSGGGSSAPAPSSSSSPSAVQSEAKPMVRVGALQGPTGLGIVELMERNEQKDTGNIYEFTLAGAPDEISSKIVSGELDLASVPTNVAATLYGKTDGKVKIIAVNTLGVLYLLQGGEGDTVERFEDLAGETIYSTGQGATQEYVLNYLLAENGVTDADVEYKSEHAELASLMAAGEVEYALLPQPFVTTVTGKAEDVRIALDITAEWESATGGNQLTMGCVVVRDDFLQKNQAAVDRFLEELDQSVAYVNENVADAAALAGKFEVISAEVAEKAIPNCNIVCLAGSGMKTSVSAYLDILFNANPQSVGGNLPDDAFYYLP